MSKQVARGVIEAAGGLVWRRTKQGLQVALVYRSRYDDWSLPKGWLHEDESWRDAALREVREEIGMDVSIRGFAGCTSYMDKGVPKVVLYWHMELMGSSEFWPNDEVDELIWLAMEQAVARLSYEGEKALVRSAFDEGTPL